MDLPDYPPPGSGKTIKDWMQPAAPSVCTNWDMVPTPTPALPLGKGHNWASKSSAHHYEATHTNELPPIIAEHIYEGFFIKVFLDDLVSRLSCATVAKLFWEIPANGNTTHWIDEVMNSLGSPVNEKFLVFLNKDVNRMKYFVRLHPLPRRDFPPSHYSLLAVLID
jgi:hypothetical protein